MDDRSTVEIDPSVRRLALAALWLWVAGITVAYLHQFLFVLHLLKPLVK